MKFLSAIVLSIAIHILLGLGVWLCLEYTPRSEVCATLEISSVELSFAEVKDDTAAVLPQDVVSLPRKPEVVDPVNLEPPADNAAMPEIPAVVDIPRPAERPRFSATDVPSSVPAPRQARIDAPPSPCRAIRPEYPKGARQRGEHGDVVIEMTVNAQGEVDRATVVTASGFPELDEAALRAVRSAKFTPARSGRESVASVARITLTFKLK